MIVVDARIVNYFAEKIKVIITLKVEKANTISCAAN